MTSTIQDSPQRGFLHGKSALITSSSRALGAAIARALARSGARTAINYHSSKEEATELARLMSAETGINHETVWGDTTTDQGVRSLINSTVEALGGAPDILVNNSGPYSKAPLVQLERDDWDRVMNGNLKAAYLASTLCIPQMKERGWGRIINVSAVSARVVNRGVYGLAKGALDILTEQLAFESAPEVTVNAISPGQIYESAEDMAAFDPNWPEEARKRTPLRRLGTRDEIAGIAVAICGPQWDMLTGATIPLDGGLRFKVF